MVTKTPTATDQKGRKKHELFPYVERVVQISIGLSMFAILVFLSQVWSYGDVDLRVKVIYSLVCLTVGFVVTEFATLRRMEADVTSDDEKEWPKYLITGGLFAVLGWGYFLVALLKQSNVVLPLE